MSEWKMEKELTYQIVVYVEMPSDAEECQSMLNGFFGFGYSNTLNGENLPRGVFVKTWQKKGMDKHLLYEIELNVQSAVTVAAIDGIKYFYTVSVKDVVDEKAAFFFAKNKTLDLNYMIERMSSYLDRENS